MTTADPTTTRHATATGKRLPGVEEARATILSAVAPPDPSAAAPIALDQATGRVLATDVIAALSMPRWPNSAMDGYALRLADVADEGLPVSQRVAAGIAPTPLATGTAARIFTGAPVPEGADTVVMQEHCRVDGNRVFVGKKPEPGANIRPAAEDFTCGEPVLTAGTQLRPQHIALAASAGAAGVQVHPRIRIALMITGDELVPAGEALGDGQIHESNGHMLAALGAQLGAEIQAIHTVADDADATRQTLARAPAAGGAVPALDRGTGRSVVR